LNVPGQESLLHGYHPFIANSYIFWMQICQNMAHSYKELKFCKIKFNNVHAIWLEVRGEKTLNGMRISQIYLFTAMV
jgi:hypothetical protein